MAEQDTIRAAAQVRNPTMLRLTFGYDETALRLLRSQRIEKVSPPSLTPPPQEGQPGYWFEVRDANNQLLYHRVLHDPFQITLEVFSQDPKESITRVPNPDRSGELMILVPDPPNAETFIFYGPPLDAKSESEPAHELVRYSFEELRR